jgi:hypothetical protein
MAEKKIDLDDPTVQVAVFGKEVEEFLTSDIGRYLLRRARSEEEEATDELVKDPEKRKETDQNLRNRIWVAKNFREWLEVAFHEGLQAMDMLKEEEHG